MMMLRTVAAVEQRPWLLFGLVFVATCVFGFLIQAAGSVYLRLRDDPIAFQYRTTLSYTSAIVGDGILIPLVNVFITSQLVIWRRRPRIAEIGGAMLLGALVTTAVHLFQAANELLNWTMTAPYRWSGLGYAHAAFMFAELSFCFFFWGQVALVAKENPRAILSHRIALVALCGLAFLRLVFADYGYIR
jgi:hypothetical protein